MPPARKSKPAAASPTRFVDALGVDHHSITLKPIKIRKGPATEDRPAPAADSPAPTAARRPGLAL